MDLEADDGENPRLLKRFRGRHREILARGTRTIPSVSHDRWTEEQRDGAWIFRPSELPAGLLAAFSGRATAPQDEPFPTAHLARRFAAALGLHELPIARATQVHGSRACLVDDLPAPGEVRDAGECDALATGLAGVGLAVQTADCVPLLLAGCRAIAAVHAGWRGSSASVATEAVGALRKLGEDPSEVRAWIGPTIGACCYEVGPEVAGQFASDFSRSTPAGRYLLDLAAVNRAQLSTAGVPAEAISVHPACTKCGGDRFASYRRDGEAAGRMIALVARVR